MTFVLWVTFALHGSDMGMTVIAELPIAFIHSEEDSRDDWVSLYIGLARATQFQAGLV